MIDKKVPSSIDKDSVEVPVKATIILAGMEDHIDQGCTHCRDLLISIYQNSQKDHELGRIFRDIEDYFKG